MDFKTLKKRFLSALHEENIADAEEYLTKIEKQYPLSPEINELRILFTKTVFGKKYQLEPEEKITFSQLLPNVKFISSIILALALISLFVYGGSRWYRHMQKVQEEQAVMTTVEQHLEQALEAKESEQYRKALAELNDAESLDPGNTEVRRLKGTVLYALGEQDFAREAYSDAVSYYRNALNHDRENLEYAIKLAISYYRLARARGNPRHYNDALEPLQDMESRGIVSGELYLRKGYIYIRMGNTEQALASWKKAVEEFPDSPYVEEARRNLRQHGF